MRITCEDHLPNHWAIFFVELPIVFLNDVPVSNVIAASEEGGLVVTYLTGSDGRPVFDYKTEEWLLVMRSGRVEIQGIKRTRS